MADDVEEPVSKRRGRGPGRPPRSRRDAESQEPPTKKRKYTRRTPASRPRPNGVDFNLDGPNGEDGAFSDGEFPRSALKSGLLELDDDKDLTFTPGRGPPEEDPVTPRTMRARTQSRPRRSYNRLRSRDPTSTPRPRYSSAAAAAAASQASDGYKPREERSWEEFHPDLDIEADLMIYTADEVDGRIRPEPKPSGLRQDTTNIESPVTSGLGIANAEEDMSQIAQSVAPTPPVKRKPGRPPRRPESMLNGLGSPPAPRILPLPTHNPKERLNLPKPSYREVHTFKAYEEDKRIRTEDYVDKAMANVGYQESEQFEIPRQNLIRHTGASYDDELGAALTLASDEKDPNDPTQQLGDVEYDMDEQDERWLEAHNHHRKAEQVDPIKPSIFEITVTQIEREFYALEKRIPKPIPRHANQQRPRSSSAAAVNGEPWGGTNEPDSKCAICDDSDCENANNIIFCDGCDLAVHQECYGVPFIPEGQWFCRKCKEIGRGTPTCIFCPNIDGAFKQTSTLRWSHLLCAIWIPEVTIANPTYMEPIQDVEKVPRNRWGLVCYICEQRMGACIQCSNKVCYQAFHVTCARRARLFLKMKATPTSAIDTTTLKAFCDRHVPPEWRRDHDTDTAIVEAKRYYRKTMRHRRWADSQTAALLQISSNETPAIEQSTEDNNADDKGTIVLGGTKRKKKEPAKTGWRLPSGAPVVPTVVFNAVEQSLVRFMLRKRKEFVAEACKYWTLKREARRGAALLKRLQLQLETSSTMEITRRNFVGMGAAGRPRLARRIEFSEHLEKDIVGLAELVTSIAEREQKKLEDAENLQKLMDSVYFPVPALLWPILRKAQKLGDKTRIFVEGLSMLEQRLVDREYVSVAAFSADVGALFAAIVAKPDLDSFEDTKSHDITEIHSQMAPLSFMERQALSAEQKQQKSVAKRIVRAIKEPLEAALRKEAELKGVPYGKELDEWAKLDAKLESCVSNPHEQQSEPLTNGTHARLNSDVSMSVLSGASESGTHSRPSISEEQNTLTSEKHEAIQAPSPPISSSSNAGTATVSMPNPATTQNPDEDPFLSLGGIPWYMRPFSPDGTSVHDERWLGPERAGSEALSEVDEATLNEMDVGESKVVKKGKTPKKSKGSRNETPRNIRVTRAGSSASVNGSGVRSSRRQALGRKGSSNDVDMRDVDDVKVEEGEEKEVAKTAAGSRSRRSRGGEASVVEKKGRRSGRKNGV